MKEMASLPHEGICSVCKKKTMVVSIGDADTKKVAHICRPCSLKLGEEGKKFSYLILEYGVVNKKKFEGGIKFLK